MKRCQCLIEAPLEHFQFFGFLFQATTVADFGRGVVFSDKEVQFLRHRTGTHVRLKYFFHVVHAVTGFLLGFVTNALLGRGTFQQPGGHLDQQSIVAVDEHRQTELAGQHHRALFAVEQQNRRAVASVVYLAGLALPLAVVAVVIESDFLQQIPVVGQHLSVDDVDPFGCVGHRV